MDTPTGGLGHLESTPEVGRQQDLDVDQQDDFDFEIGGDGAFDLPGGAENEEADLIHDGDATEAPDAHDESYMHLSENDAQASPADQYDSVSLEYGQDVTDGVPFDFDSLAEAVEDTQDAQTDPQPNRNAASPEDSNIEDGIEEHIYPNQTLGEPETLAEAIHSEDHDLKYATTSVSYIQEGNGPLDSTFDARENNTETAVTDDSGPQESHFVEEEAQEQLQNANTSGKHAYANHAIVALSAIDAKEAEAGGEIPGAEPFANDAYGNDVSTSLNQPNWDEGEGEEENDNSDHIPAGPTVTVSYSGQEYSMFAQSPEDDPDTYFLDEVGSIHQPLSQFLDNLHKVVSSELKEDQELFVRIDGLGLEFGESTTKSFLHTTTLAQIIEVNNKLSQHDGGSQHAELYIFLSVQSDPLQRFRALVKGAEEGQGLSHFEQYYEPSVDVSEVIDDEGEHESFLSIEADDGTQDKRLGVHEEVEHATGDILNTHQYSNPFRDNNPQQLSGGANPFQYSDNETQEIVEGKHGNFDRQLSVNMNGPADDGHEGDHDSLEAAAMDLQTTSLENDYGGATPLIGYPEIDDSAEGWAGDSVMDVLSGQERVETEEVTDEQAEVLVDEPEEGYDRTDDYEPNLANDEEDYLDLGDDDGGHMQFTAAATTVDSFTEQCDIQRQITPNSSATGTLNGEENGHGAEVAASQITTADPIQAPNTTTNTEGGQNDNDEIDWNHDEDDGIGNADQKPTSLSPSSLSAKRGRQEDEAIDGVGDDNAAKRRRT